MDFGDRETEVLIYTREGRSESDYDEDSKVVVSVK